MLRSLYYAHSGLRYLVLLAGLALLAYAAVGLASKRPAGRPARILGAVFVGLLDTQILIGLLLVAQGLYYPRLIGHIVLMVLAAAVAHVALAINRRRPSPGWSLPLLAAVAALVLIVGGLAAIGRSPFGSTAFGG